MPVNIYDLEVDRKTATLELGQGSLTVTYRPNQLTPAREMAILRAARAEGDAEGDDDAELEQAERNITRQIATFEELVEAWDFEGPLAIGADGERLNLPRGIEQDEALAFVAERGGTLLVAVGDTVPVRAQYLRLLPSHFLMRVVNLINEDMRPDPKRKRR